MKLGGEKSKTGFGRADILESVTLIKRPWVGRPQLPCSVLPKSVFNPLLLALIPTLPTSTDFVPRSSIIAYRCNSFSFFRPTKNSRAQVFPFSPSRLVLGNRQLCVFPFCTAQQILVAWKREVCVCLAVV